jgi:hypothetical protein
MQDFLDNHPSEIVILYLDTKFFPSPANAAQGYDDMIGVFGDAIWRVRPLRQPMILLECHSASIAWMC